MNLNKTNNKNKFFPIVFICNTQHSKMISEIRKTSLEVNMMDEKMPKKIIFLLDLAGEALLAH